MPAWKTILVPIDFSEDSLAALRYAVRLRPAHDATLVLVHVVPRGAILDEVIPRLHDLGGTIPQSHREVVAVIGHPVERLVDVAREQAADLTIVASHGHTGLEASLIGSTAAGLVREAPCPVLVLRHRPEPLPAHPGVRPEPVWLHGRKPMPVEPAGADGDLSFTRIVVPTDMSDLSMAAFAPAVEVARVHGATVVLVNVLERPGDAVGSHLEILEGLARGVDGVQATAAVAFGDPVSAIVSVAQDLRAEMVVTSTHGRRGLQRVLFGSVAEGVVRHAPCPVLTVKAAPHHERLRL